MELQREVTLVITPEHPRAARPAPRWRLWKDSLGHAIMGGMACLVILLLGVIAITLFQRSWPLFATYPLTELLLSTTWQPMRGAFGLAPFIVGSALVTLVAMVIAVPLAILSGVYLAEYTSTRVRLAIKPVIDLLAGIPPVVYGLWGILVIVPFIRTTIAPWMDQHLGEIVPFFANRNPSGYGLLAAGAVLGMMVFPLIVAIIEEVLRAVPRELRESLHALGATRWEATKVVLLRAGLPGVMAAVVLGFSRAFGETLAVMMVVGNVPRIPRSLFDGAYTLPALLANNYGEMMSVPLYESALMGVAFALLLVVVVFNIGARIIITRQIAKGAQA